MNSPTHLDLCRNPRIKEINIITDVGCAYLSRCQWNLISLHLNSSHRNEGGNKIGREGAYLISKGNWPNLQEISLGTSWPTQEIIRLETRVANT